MSLATRGAVVAPMNGIPAQWEPGPIPQNSRPSAIAGITAIKTVSLCCTIAAVVSLTRPHTTAGS